MNFTEAIIAWYNLNKRELPWRTTNNAYAIWLSEIILQQTRVAQGLPFFEKFIDAYPTISDFAKAPEDDVLQLWQGLGYYSRARNLHFTAKQIHENHKGEFPNNYAEIIKLKGIGPYTAAAIASFAFQEKKAVVDGNVYRVLARYFGITDDINSTSAKKYFQKLADDLIDEHRPDIYNQAIMDFGAMICTPKNPECHVCVLKNSCFALEHNVVHTLPFKSKKTAVKKRYFHYLIAQDDDHIYIKQRTEKDIWQGLYDFPLYETDAHFSEKKVAQYWKDTFKILPKQLKFNPQPINHILTHQHLYIYFWKVESALSENCLKIPASELKNFPFPIVLWNEVISEI